MTQTLNETLRDYAHSITGRKALVIGAVAGSSLFFFGTLGGIQLANMREEELQKLERFRANGAAEITQVEKDKESAADLRVRCNGAFERSLIILQEAGKNSVAKLDAAREVSKTTAAFEAALGAENMIALRWEQRLRGCQQATTYGASTVSVSFRATCRGVMNQWLSRSEKAPQNFLTGWGQNIIDSKNALWKMLGYDVPVEPVHESLAPSAAPIAAYTVTWPPSRNEAHFNAKPGGAYFKAAP